MAERHGAGGTAHDAVAVVIAFNEAINARDVDALVALMTPDHRFVDSAGGTVEGAPACREAWAGFFEAFPDYRNELEVVELLAAGTVGASGRSHCSAEALRGPAVWSAEVVDGRISLWRVGDPGASES